MKENKIFVAVGKEVEERKSTLEWALKKSKGEAICVIYVHVPAQIIHLPKGEVKPFQEWERKEVFKILDDCLQMCAKYQVRSEKIYVERESITDGILEVISQLRIQKLVMGGAANNRYSRRMKKPASKKANYVLNCAPDFCYIWFVCKDHLICIRKGMKQLNQHIEENQLNRLSYSESSVYSVSAESTGSSSPLTQSICFGSSAASIQVKATQRLNFEELRQREEVEEELAESNKELEVTKDLLEKVLQELHEALDQKFSLESQLKNLSLSEKEMLEKLLSAVDLLQLYKNRRDELQVERNHALQEAEELRKELAGKPSSSHVSMFFSEFSFSDLEKATNYFDPSLKIGKGGYGSTYKGFLHHTEVAIRIFKPNTSHGAQEFEQEVDVLSKLRHPNLVTLIGVCHESWALVYEYFPRGSLEDRLICKDKDNTPPLPWQVRIQIATQLCSVLIFLHSSQPSSIIHGNLNPANILLDDNLVCKLYDFGKSCVILDGRVAMEQTARFTTSELNCTFTYIDPEFLATGVLTPKSDIYSFGIILLHLLTGKPAFGIAKEVEYALDSDDLNATLDPSAGDWPFLLAEQLARMALRCCDMNPWNRPDLGSDIWRVLEPMKASSLPLSTHLLSCEDRAPHYFLCPILQEMMDDPQFASDGFTYEAEAIRGWLDSGHHTSPMTNVKLANQDLIPNRALRSAIQEWQHRRNV